MNFFSDELKRRNGTPLAMSEIERLLPADAQRWLPLNQDQYIEAKTLLAGYLLSSQGDRRITSYNVCYTKLLRIFRDGPRLSA